MDAGVLSSFGGNLAAMALAGGLYFGFRVLQRAKCSSHNECCDFELSKAETQRDDRIFLRIIESLRKEDGAPAVPVHHAGPGEAGPSGPELV